MASLWRWGSIDIYVEDEDEGAEVYDAVLKVLDSQSNVIQQYGAGSERIHIVGIVIGEANKDSIISDARAGTTRTFVSDQGSQGTFKIIETPKATRIGHSGAFVDGVVYPATTPLYRLDMNIINTA